MTDRQKHTIELIKKDIPYFDFYNSEDYEIKEFNITDEKYFVYVSFTTGRKGDEGTLASILCRKHRRAFIGKKGGIKVLNSKNNFVAVSRFNFMNKCYEH